MALVVSDRIKETTTTTGTGTYTLAGAVTGFETFTANLSNGDTTYYACSDGTDFEVGLGTFTSSGTTLARTTILASSNSNAAVSWSSGTRTIFCTLPAAKAVFKDASGHVNFVDNEKAIFGTGGDLEIYHDGSNSIIKDNGTGNIEITGRTLIKNTNGETMADFIQNSRVDLYHDNSKKFETTSTGATVTGTLVSDVVSIADGSSTGDRLTIGTNDDFFIYHDFSPQTVIANVAGQGPIKIQGKFGEQSIIANQDGSVELYHNNVKKVETSSTGATVTGELKTTTLEIGGTDVTSTAAELNILDGVTATTSELNIMDGVTSTTAELNILDGVTATAAEINKLDGVTATTTELNYVDVTTLGTVEASKAVTADANGDVLFPDNEVLQLGTGGDLRIFHDGTNNIFRGFANPMYIQTDNTVHVTKNNNAETMAKFIGDGAVELYHNNVKKFETTAQGFGYFTSDVAIEFSDQSNNGVVEIGGSAGALIDLKSPKTDDFDFRLQVNSSNTAFVQSDDLHLISRTNGENYLDATVNGAVNLYYDNVKKFETTSAGATVTGGLTVVGGDTGDVLLTFATDRSWQFQQIGDDANTQLQLKANTDSKIFSIANNNGDNDFFFFTSHTGTPYFYLGEDAQIRFEGATDNAYETILTVTDPTALRTITLPDATGTVLTTGNSDTPTTTTSSADADFVLVDDGGTMKKITPANLGITSGSASKGFAVAMAIAL